MTPFIDFNPHIDDIPNTLLTQIITYRPLISLNRQKTKITAEHFTLSTKITTLNKQ